MNKFEEKIVEVVLDGLKKFAKNYIHERKWIDYFNDTVSFFTRNNNKDFVNEQLSELFSECRIKKFARIMKDGNGYSFKNAIENELWDIMKVFDATNEEKNLFISRFMTCLLEYIKRNNPDIYSQYLTEELSSNVKNELVLINSLKNDIVELKKIIKNIDYSLSIFDYESKLKNASEKNISLSFFESDDKNFIDEFFKSLNTKSSIFISGNSRYEVLLSVLFELKKYYKETYIIYDEDDWKKVCINCQLKNKVFIPYFFSNHIQAMPNNITIFIYDDIFTTKRNDVISIERRKYSFVTKKLLEAGYDYSESYELLQLTHGFFIPLFKRLCEKDSFVYKYNYENADLKCILCSLLLGQWTENNGDKKIIEAIVGIPYASFVNIMKKYSLGDNPLVFRYTTYNETKYFVTSLEDAWFEFEYFLEEDIWNNYLSIIELILFNVDKKYETLSEEKNPFIKNNYSNNLKEGIYKSLMIITFVLKRKELSNDVNVMISKCLNEIKIINQWASISKHITYISELCPEIFLERIELELDNQQNTGFVDLFNLKTDLLFGENYYINYLWALEQLLVQNKYVYRSLDILFKLNDLNINYKISNSPEKTLNNVFCSWINLSCIRDFDKVKVLKKYIDKNKSNISFALENLPGKHMTISGNLSAPKYRISEVLPETTNKAAYEVSKGYLELCFEEMPNNIQIVKKLIDSITSFYSLKIIEEFFNKLSSLLNKFDDVDLYIVELELRNVIYRHRFYCNSDWALDEKFIKYYINCLEKIKYKNPCYSFKYLFEKNYDFPLLNPIPYESDDYSNVHKNNEKKETIEIQEKIDLFIKKKYDLANLISICDSNETTIGTYISKFTHSIYSRDILMMVINNQRNNKVLENYAWNVLKNNKDCYLQLINELLDIKYDENSLVNVLSYYPLDEKFIFLIDSIESVEFKKKYWSRYLRVSREFKSFDIIFDRLNLYADDAFYIENLYQYREYISIEKIYSYAIALNTKKISISFNINYQLYEILKDIRKSMKLDDNDEDALATLELKFWQILEWNEMYFFRKALVKNANYYSKLLQYIYKNDDGIYHPEYKEYASMMYKLYNKLEFCPGVIDNKFYPDIFDEWVFDFKNNLIKQKQLGLFSSMIGKLCCYSPIGLDGYPLDEHIRSFIESNYTRELASSFIASEINKRGVYSYTEGEAEHNMAIQYKEYADYFRKDYPKCAYIYDIISDDYESQSNNDKVESRYEN